jgi:voltage-gated potassium channel
MRKKLYVIIFQSNTWAGKLFDLILILSILVSVAVVMLDSVQSIHAVWGSQLYAAEWLFTLLFTLEFIARVYCISDPSRYVFSFFGVVDICSVLPTYLGLIVPGTEHFLVIRVLRVLRIFRVLKFFHYVSESHLLISAFYRSRHKIAVFLLSVSAMIVIFGSLMYIIETEYNSGFTSIPVSVYWAIVTMTTVGYGDISPQTPLGQMLASVIMIMGYSIIAVPGGIVTANIISGDRKKSFGCVNCKLDRHDTDAKYCKQCGEKLAV